MLVACADMMGGLCVLACITWSFHLVLAVVGVSIAIKISFPIRLKAFRIVFLPLRAVAFIVAFASIGGF